MDRSSYYLYEYEHIVTQSTGMILYASAIVICELIRPTCMPKGVSCLDEYGAIVSQPKRSFVTCWAW